jgi:hypothetical protein
VFDLLNNFTLASLRLPWLSASLVDGASAGGSLLTPTVAGLALEPGDMCGRYEVVRLLGAGAMGRVYLATDTELSTLVALKILSDALLESSEARIRLRGEAQRAAKLRGHPHIATLLDLIHVDVKGRQFPVIVMEYVEGMSCAAHIAEHPISLKRALRWASQIADAVEFAHDRGVLHCDLKPQNVQITQDDNVKVLDFGISRALYGPSTAEVATGTPAYMAPEQIFDRRFTEAGDVYSLGVTIFELVTRERPFAGETIGELVLGVLGSPAPKASAVATGVPQALDVLLERTMAKVPRRRPQSVAELRRGLAEIRDALEPNGQPSRRWVWGLVAFCTVFAAATFTGFVTSRAYDMSLGRTGRFDDESPLWWPFWGFRMLFAPTVLSAAVLLPVVVMTIGIAWAARRIGVSGRRRSLTAVVSTLPLAKLATGVFVGSAIALYLFVWRFLPMISAFQALIGDATSENIAILRPENFSEHNAYRYAAFLLLVVPALACGMIAARRANRSESVGFVAPLAGVVVLGGALALWAMPYRLLWHAELESVRLGSERCYVAARQQSDVLLFCPGSQPPRTRAVGATDARLDWRDSRIEKIFTEFDTLATTR